MKKTKTGIVIGVILITCIAVITLVILNASKTFLLVGLHGITFSGLLFLFAGGFTLSYGLMNISNLAHGSIYLLGGYIGYSIASKIDNWYLALIVGAITAALAGGIIYQVLIKHIQGNEMRESLLTLGISIVIADLLLAVYGGSVKDFNLPDVFQGVIEIGSSAFRYPIFRLVVLLIAILIGIFITLIMKKTRLGMAIRAAVDDREMLSAIGVNVSMISLIVFSFGSFLAGLAGIIGGSFLSLAPGEDGRILLYSLAVVVVGGKKNIIGSIVGALLIGMSLQFAAVYAPAYSMIIAFGLMALILAVKPQGLLGK